MSFSAIAAASQSSGCLVAMVNDSPPTSYDVTGQSPRSPRRRVSAGQRLGHQWLGHCRIKAPPAIPAGMAGQLRRPPS